MSATKEIFYRETRTVSNRSGEYTQFRVVAVNSEDEIPAGCAQCTGPESDWADEVSA